MNRIERERGPTVWEFIKYVILPTGLAVALISWLGGAG